MNTNNPNNDILNNETSRTKGIDAQNSNIEAAKSLAQIVKSTLGPMGMDKMLIDSMGDTIITNDGVKILKEMEIEHPGAKMLVEVAKTQEAEVGDGTTTAVILSGELLENAQKLLKQGIHPTKIIRNYKLASIEAIKILNKKSIPINIESKKEILNISKTAISGKMSDIAKEDLSNLIFEAISKVKEENHIPKDRIKILKIPGGDIEDSKIIDGIVLDRELAHPNMNQKKTNAKILLIDFQLEIREIEANANVNINSVKDYDEFIEAEKDYLKSLVFKIKEIGTDVVICQKGIDDSVAYYLAKEGIMAIRRCRRSDLEKLSHALNTKIISSQEDLIESNLGIAGNVERKEILGENFIFIEKCSNPKAITLLLKSSTKHILDEIKRAVEDALGDINSILKSKKIVAGGGAIELELYKSLNEYSKKIKGKDSIIINEYAKAFLSIPRTLCENCGLDTIDIITELKLNHNNGKIYSGINSFKGIVPNTYKEGIIEPINIKIQAIKSATEISSMILRIDDIIAAKKLIETNEFNEFRN